MKEKIRCLPVFLKFTNWFIYKLFVPVFVIYDFITGTKRFHYHDLYELQYSKCMIFYQIPMSGGTGGGQV